MNIKQWKATIPETLCLTTGLIASLLTFTLSHGRRRLWLLLAPYPVVAALFAMLTVWGPPYAGLLVLFVGVATAVGHLAGMLLVLLCGWLWRRAGPPDAR